MTSDNTEIKDKHEDEHNESAEINNHHLYPRLPPNFIAKGPDRDLSVPSVLKLSLRLRPRQRAQSHSPGSGHGRKCTSCWSPYKPHSKNTGQACLIMWTLLKVW